MGDPLPEAAYVKSVLRRWLAGPRQPGQRGATARPQLPKGLDDSRMFSLKSVATVGGLTLASRALGFLREVLMAQFFGTGPIAEAFCQGDPDWGRRVGGRPQRPSPRTKRSGDRGVVALGWKLQCDHLTGAPR